MRKGLKHLCLTTEPFEFLLRMTQGVRRLLSRWRFHFLLKIPKREAMIPHCTGLSRHYVWVGFSWVHAGANSPRAEGLGNCGRVVSKPEVIGKLTGVMGAQKHVCGQRERVISNSAKSGPYTTPRVRGFWAVRASLALKM